MSRVDQMIEEVIRREGDYSNHPADKGGPTRWGITQAVARANGYAGDMRRLPIELARRIYRDIYWSGPGFDRIEPIYPKVADELLDTGINMGPAVAAGFLQRAINAFNREGRDYPDIPIDRRIGPRTAGAVQSFKQRRGVAGEAVLLKALDALQGARYLELSEGRPANEAFTYGWFDSRIGNAK